MPDPKSLDECNEKYMKNHRIEGRGLGTCSILPCPGCAAADWLKFPVTAGLNDYKDISKPTECKECKRVFQFLFARIDGTATMELVQVSGDDMPKWFHPKPRRL